MSGNNSAFTAQTKLWRWSELTEALNLRSVDGPSVSRVITDSRQVQPGDLFIALKGDPGPRFNAGYRSSVDGHDFIGAAREAGAVGCLSMRAVADMPTLQVEDTYDGLWQLGRKASQRHSGWRVGLTGSSGKTTAKTFLEAATGAYASPGSFNNYLGVPLSLANCAAERDGAVFEIGTNHPGEIEPLAEMVSPHVALLLNVHHAHRENFPTQSDLYKEKTSIFNALIDKDKAVSEESLGLDYGSTFGTSAAADARLVELEDERMRVNVDGRRLLARVPGGGEHRAMSLLACLLVIARLERPLDAACELPAELIPAGRGNRIAVGGCVITDDSYNANPQSMQAAIKAFASNSERPKTFVLGEMLELGELGLQAALDIATLTAELVAKDSRHRVIFVGQGMRAAANSIDAPWFPEADQATLDAVTQSLAKDSEILIKGSNRVFWRNGFVAALKGEIESLFHV